MSEVAEEVQEVESTESQCADIMAYLKRNPYITRGAAMAELGVGNITARISELRKKGEPIQTMMVPYLKANGKRTRIAKWFLEAA